MIRPFTSFGPRRRLVVAAPVLDENAAMRRGMQRLGPTVRTTEDGSPAPYTRLPAGRRRAA